MNLVHVVSKKTEYVFPVADFREMVLGCHDDSGEARWRVLVWVKTNEDSWKTEGSEKYCRGIFAEIVKQVGMRRSHES